MSFRSARSGDNSWIRASPPVRPDMMIAVISAHLSHLGDADQIGDIDDRAEAAQLNGTHEGEDAAHQHVHEGNYRQGDNPCLPRAIQHIGESRRQFVVTSHFSGTESAMLKNLAIVVGLMAGLSACIPSGYNGYDNTGYGYTSRPTSPPRSAAGYGRQAALSRDPHAVRLARREELADRRTQAGGLTRISMGASGRASSRPCGCFLA
jgi:hypothetical protein